MGGNYLIFNNGKILSKRSFKFLSQSNGRYKTTSLGKVHILVATYFVPNPNSLPEVNHENGNTHNNWDWNLNWVTSKQNKEHAKKLGLIKGGINDKIREQIRCNFKSGKFTKSGLARKYKTSRRNIINITRGMINPDFANGNINGSKLSWDEVNTIRKTFRTGIDTYSEFGLRFNITPSCIKKIIKGISWVQR